MTIPRPRASQEKDWTRRTIAIVSSVLLVLALVPGASAIHFTDGDEDDPPTYCKEETDIPSVDELLDLICLADGEVDSAYEVWAAVVNDAWNQTESTINERWQEEEKNINEHWNATEEFMNGEWDEAEESINREYDNTEDRSNDAWNDTGAAVNALWNASNSSVDSSWNITETLVNSGYQALVEANYDYFVQAALQPDAVVCGQEPVQPRLALEKGEEITVELEHETDRMHVPRSVQVIGVEAFEDHQLKYRTPASPTFVTLDEVRSSTEVDEDGDDKEGRVIFDHVPMFQGTWTITNDGDRVATFHVDGPGTIQVGYSTLDWLLNEGEDCEPLAPFLGSEDLGDTLTLHSSNTDAEPEPSLLTDLTTNSDLYLHRTGANGYTTPDGDVRNYDSSGSIFLSDAETTASGTEYWNSNCNPGYQFRLVTETDSFETNDSDTEEGLAAHRTYSYTLEFWEPQGFNPPCEVHLVDRFEDAASSTIEVRGNTTDTTGRWNAGMAANGLFTYSSAMDGYVSLGFNSPALLLQTDTDSFSFHEPLFYHLDDQWEYSRERCEDKKVARELPLRLVSWGLGLRGAHWALETAFDVWADFEASVECTDYAYTLDENPYRNDKYGDLPCHACLRYPHSSVQGVADFSWNAPVTYENPGWANYNIGVTGKWTEGLALWFKPDGGDWEQWADRIEVPALQTEIQVSP